jgi:hypothetical protein
MYINWDMFCLGYIKGNQGDFGSRLASTMGYSDLQYFLRIKRQTSFFI